MGGFESIDEGIVAGGKIGNADIDSSAAINPRKIEKRLFSIEAPLANAVLSGSAALTATYNFNEITLPVASSAGFSVTLPYPRGEISPGERLKIKIGYWVGGSSGDVRLVVNIKPATQGISNLGSAIERAIITTAGSANTLSIAEVEFPPSVFNNNQILAISISRDPANTLDTFGANIAVIFAVAEIYGRC